MQPFISCSCNVLHLCISSFLAASTLSCFTSVHQFLSGCQYPLMFYICASVPFSLPVPCFHVLHLCISSFFTASTLKSFTSVHQFFPCYMSSPFFYFTPVHQSLPHCQHPLRLHTCTPIPSVWVAHTGTLRGDWLLGPI